jgi:two-component system phosphate regulon sensor histidine kinase PhoR
MFASFRWRVIVTFSLLILLSIAGVGFYLTNFLYQTQLEFLQDRLTDDALLISDSQIISPSDEYDLQAINDKASHWAELLNVRVTIIAKDGIVLGESHQKAAMMDNHINRPEIQEAILNGVGSNIRYSQTVKYDMLYVAIASIQDGQLIGFVRVSLPLEEIEARQAKSRNSILATMTVALGLGVILSFFVAMRMTRPLHLLTQEAKLITQGETARKIPTNRRDEVGQLTRAFNALVEKLHSQISSLQSEQGKLESILNQMTDGVVIVDYNGKIILINTTAERMFDTHAEIAMENMLAQVLRNHQWIELWEDCRSSGKEQTKTLEIPRQGIFIQGIALPLGDSLPDHVLMVFSDLTRIRRLETVRRDFISNISHELRTPLASLKALVETLRTGALEDPPAARRFLYRVETEVDALTQMVSELLELSRIESGQVPLKLKSVRPRRLLTKAAERLSVQAERNQLNITVDCPKKLPLVFVDKPRMGQVLVNLLHNAIKFTPPGGKITLCGRQDGDFILFSVEDTGYGIPPEDLPRVFERFYKTDPARSGGGTGLGLAIARHLVEAHGGEIWVESVENQGSKFSFTIPIE